MNKKIDLFFNQEIMFHYLLLTIYRVCATVISFHLGHKRKDKSKHVLSMIICGIIFGLILFHDQAQ